MAERDLSKSPGSKLTAPRAIVELRLSEKESTKFTNLKRPESKVEFLLKCLATQHGNSKIDVLQHLSGKRSEQYADVWKVKVGEQELALKFRHPSKDISIENASNLLSLDAATLRRNRPGVIPCWGVIRDFDDEIVAVLSHFDDSPNIIAAWKDKKITEPELEKKLLAFADELKRAGYNIVDDNSENFHLRDDGSLVLVDGAAISRTNTFVRAPDGTVFSDASAHGSSEEEQDFGSIEDRFYNDFESVALFPERDEHNFGQHKQLEPREVVAMIMENVRGR